MNLSLGLAYQSAKPIVDRSYDIIKDQLDYVEKQKGAREAAKRQAQIENNKLLAGFHKEYAIKPLEAPGYYAKQTQEITTAAIENIQKAGALLSTNPQEAYALAQSIHAGLKSFEQVVTAVGYNDADAAIQRMGKDFEYSEELNWDRRKLREEFINGGWLLRMDDLGKTLMYRLNEEGETEEYFMDELHALLEQQPKASVDIMRAGMAFAKQQDDFFKTGTKYNNVEYRTWDGPVPEGYVTIKQKAYDHFNGNSSRDRPMPEFETYAVRLMQKSYSEISDQEYETLVDDFINDTYRSSVSEYFQENRDPLGEQNITSQINTREGQLQLGRDRLNAANQGDDDEDFYTLPFSVQSNTRLTNVTGGRSNRQAGPGSTFTLPADVQIPVRAEDPSAGEVTTNKFFLDEETNIVYGQSGATWIPLHSGAFNDIAGGWGVDAQILRKEILERNRNAPPTQPRGRVAPPVNNIPLNDDGLPQIIE